MPLEQCNQLFSAAVALGDIQYGCQSVCYVVCQSARFILAHNNNNTAKIKFVFL